MYSIHIRDVRFEWDALKDSANHLKHGISFAEALTVFFDEHAQRFFDPDHSQDEDRFIQFGLSAKQRVLVVSYCFREGVPAIRIISERKAVPQEAEDYGR
jgi:uncharacterized DUF497 family protein